MTLGETCGKSPLLARMIHDNWMFDCKLFEGMSLWQTHLKQSAHAGVPALAGMSVSWPLEGGTPTTAAESSGLGLIQAHSLPFGIAA